MIRQILYSTTYPKISQIREPCLSKVGRGLHGMAHKTATFYFYIFTLQK